MATGFYSHQACPAGRYGCVFSRTVSDERVTNRLDCPSPYSSYVGGQVLRRLAVAETSDRPARAPLVRARDQLRGCFGATSAQVDLEILVDATGAVLATNNTAADPTCISRIVSTLRFTSREPRTTRTLLRTPRPTSTVLRARLDYTAEDPTTYAKPLACP